MDGPVRATEGESKLRNAARGRWVAGLAVFTAASALTLVLAPTAGAQRRMASSRSYNKPGLDPERGPVPLKSEKARLLDATGKPLRNAKGEDLYIRGKGYDECPPAARARYGCVILHRLEVINTENGPTYFVWGGPEGQNRESGSISVNDVDVRDLKLQGDSQRGNGKRAAAWAGKTYTVCTAPVPSGMRYRRTDKPEPGSFGHYGLPAEGASHTTLLWSWPAQRGGKANGGGGVTRAMIADGATVQLTRVRSIRTRSIDASGKTNGWVRAVYVRFNTGRQDLHGWLVSEHQYESRGGGVVRHLVSTDEQCAR